MGRYLILLLLFPALVQAATCGSNLSLSWDALTGMDGYRVYVNGVEEYEGPETTVAPGDLSMSFVAGTTYTFTVSAYKDAAEATPASTGQIIDADGDTVYDLATLSCVYQTATPDPVTNPRTAP